MRPTWQILIPTLVERKEQFNRLCDELFSWIDGVGLAYGKDVEILSLCDNREMSVGQKRQRLLESATARYISFFDDDDWPTHHYIDSNWIGILDNSDVIMLRGIITVDGSSPQEFIHSIEYDSYFAKSGVYYRPPNHLNCMRREIARQAIFEHKNHGEDTDWAMQLVNRGVWKQARQHEIAEPIYYYRYSPGLSATVGR